MKKAMIQYMKNIKNDELYTPEYAIEPLIKYLSKNMVIWECTDYGASNITKVLKENGFKVINTNKSEINFLQNDVDFYFDMIITNPPYSLKDKFIMKCYEYNKPFCLLLPITALEGVVRNNYWRKYGIDLLVFDKRVEYMNKSCYFNTSWFCYKVLPKQLIFEELNK